MATGVRTARPSVPGSDLEGVFQLRTVADADRIRTAAASATHAVVVGMGFIGAEVTASLRTLGLEVTVVEVFETALLKILGLQLGRVLASIHRDHGVTMRFGDTVERFEGSGRVERVITAGGATIGCDLVIVGVGTAPATDAVGALPIADDGGVEVGETLATSVPGVFAAGDVASHAHPVFGRVRVEHFDNAIKMGEHAGARCSARRPRSTIRIGSGPISTTTRSRWAAWRRPARWWCEVRSRTGPSARSSSTRVGRCGRA